MTNVRIVSRFGQKSLLNALTAVERARKWEREREREGQRTEKRLHRKKRCPDCDCSPHVCDICVKCWYDVDITAKRLLSGCRLSLEADQLMKSWYFLSAPAVASEVR